jgi:alpha-ketoglutarate-dependent taurine dioxygenase
MLIVDLDARAQAELHPAAIDAISSSLDRTGFWYSPPGGGPHLDALAAALGRVIERTQVRPTPTSRSLVCSKRRLGPHTDHYRADFIAWQCHRQADSGGETFVVDPFPVLDRLPPHARDLVSNTRVYEHRIFEDDPESRPIVTDTRGRPRIYFTYWLAKSVDPAQAEAVELFRDALEEESREFCRRLEPGEILVVDNRPMLHGREAFTGDRHLERVWISESQTPLVRLPQWQKGGSE